MNPLVHLARYHTQHYGYGYHSGSWITHMIVSSIVHALIYSAIFRLLRGFSTGEVLLLVGAVILALYWLNNRRSRRW